MTDGQLLECFIRRREEAALAALVRRHGPMVWGVCRRVLRNHHDAEDAFQAVFLVLVRKAASVAPRERVANWLYGVAYQTARKARATAAKRGARERQVTEMPEPVAEQGLVCDLQPLLDEELSRLPDKYRVPIVLCDLHGKTRKEAARQIGCPEGTVAGRLARARAMLAKRLARRGQTASGGALAMSASVPTSVMASTIKAATLVAAGQAAAGVVSVKAAALTEGVLKAMLLTKLKTAAAVLLAVAALSGAAGLICRTRAEGPTNAQRAAEPKTDDGRWTAGQAEEPKPDKPGLSLDDLRGKWAGEKSGIKVALTFTGGQAHWQVEFTRSRKPEFPFQSPETGVSLDADLKCVADAKEAGRFNLYLPAYLGDNKEIKQSARGGGKPVGEIQRGADRTIQLRIIPTAYENPAQEDDDYPAVEGLVLRRAAEPAK